MPSHTRALPGIMKASTQQGSVVVPGQVSTADEMFLLYASPHVMCYDNDFFVGTSYNSHVGCCPIARTEADAWRAHLSTHPGFFGSFCLLSSDNGESYGL